MRQASRAAKVRGGVLAGLVVGLAAAPAAWPQTSPQTLPQSSPQTSSPQTASPQTPHETWPKALASFPTTHPAIDCSSARDPMQRFYPAEAQRTRTPGQAAVACRLASDGRPTQCTWTTEEPEGFGFGEAAAQVICTVRFKPPQPGASGVILTMMRFKLPE